MVEVGMPTSTVTTLGATAGRRPVKGSVRNELKASSQARPCLQGYTDRLVTILAAPVQYLLVLASPAHCPVVDVAAAPPPQLLLAPVGVVARPDASARGWAVARTTFLRRLVTCHWFCRQGMAVTRSGAVYFATMLRSCLQRSSASTPARRVATTWESRTTVRQAMTMGSGGDVWDEVNRRAGENANALA